MDNGIKTWLSDIEKAISEINQFLPNREDFEAFHNDLKTKRAIERNIEIIGEAMSRILKVKPDFPITTARKIIDWTFTNHTVGAKRIFPCLILITIY